MIQVHVSDQVLDDARGRQREGEASLTPAQVKRIAKRLGEGINGLPPEEYREQLRERVKKFALAQDVDLPTPDTRSTFWSYQLEDHPGIDAKAGEALYSMHMAAAYTEAQNSITPDTLRYLEGTPGGKTLGELHLWDAQVQNALGLNKEAGTTLAYDAWGALSEKYAAKTENEALFFMAELNPNTVAYQTESRQLRQDGKLDIINFMYPAPTQKYADLAPETQELLTSQAVRAQVHTFAYDEKDPKYTPLTKAGHLDLKQLAALPTPEAQRAAVLEVCARVATMDGPARAADVEKLVEEIKVLRPDHEVTLPSVEDQQWAAELRNPEKGSPARPFPVAVSTHGQYLPGVEVNARTAPARVESSTVPASEAATVRTHGFLTGVTPQPKPVTTLDRNNTSAAPTQAPPAPEQSRDPGMGV
ncbi:hypothetical protein SAMN04487983_100733 [Streptomyces sp. yr375]|uniref:hypothetical protein n=1 Tax=Streptomyces sp. yr375 TaxID=1761906 RepID=UPI0008B529E6|nr:hypothetical protein [Streptomyces sp. yr375]SEQ66871.1 hypothetical protein SAMN04487983_100733 [Streptomyces sp. yr375]